MVTNTTYRKFRDRDQIVEVSEFGGTIMRWTYHGVDILYPQREVQQAGVQKTRGGMHPCFPNFGTVDARFGLPQHGPLRKRRPDAVYGSVLLFHGHDFLGSLRLEEIEVMINVALEPTGMIYTLAARLPQPTIRPVFINFGLHPYFRTPETEATVTAPRHRRIIIKDSPIEPRHEEIDNDATVVIPGIGSIHMRLSGSAWEQAKQREIVLWRDAKNYLCVEPVLGPPKSYGTPECLQLSDKWLDMKCRFQVRLEA